MAKTLAIRELQTGVSSMDYVDSLLLLEPEDENGSDQEPNLDANTSPVQVPQPSHQSIDQEPVPEWCKCTCCRTMPQEIENKCCGRRNCVSQGRRFSQTLFRCRIFTTLFKEYSRHSQQTGQQQSYFSQSCLQKLRFRHTWLPWKREEENCSLLLCSLYSPALSISNRCIYGFSSLIEGH